MRNLFAIFLLLQVLSSGCQQSRQHERQQINSRIGDISFIEKFGKAPDQHTPEDLRISTHLEYVETRLRERKVDGLAPEVREKRRQMLDLLHQYRIAGIFPRNYDHPDERKSCFIDKDGRICAVGFLIEQTAGRETAEAINRKHQYDQLLAMNSPEVAGWVAGSGLSKEECAMIQPMYGAPPTINHNYISPEKAIASGMLGGLNVSMAAINTIQLAQGSQNKTVPVIGLATGLGSVIYGIASMPEEDHFDFSMYPRSNETSKSLSMVNIGLGTCTMALSAWNLFSGKPKTEKKMTWNVYGYPTPDKQPVVGVNMTFKL